VAVRSERRWRGWRGNCRIGCRDRESGIDGPSRCDGGVPGGRSSLSFRPLARATPLPRWSSSSSC